MTPTSQATEATAPQVISSDGAFTTDPFSTTEIPSLDAYHEGPAVLLSADTDPTRVAPLFSDISVIVIPFAASSDGRGFSLASTLRAMGYAGHLRARGHVLVDQFRAALRSGFDDVEISAAQALRNPEPQWRGIAMGQSYQSRVFA